MPKLRMCELADVLGRLPELGRFKPESGGVLPRMVDLFICALGFEPRCLTIPEVLAQHGYQARKVAYCEYATNPEDNTANRSRLLSSLESVSTDVQGIQADHLSFTSRIRDLLQEARGIAAAPTPIILVDVSVMANRLIMKLMKALLEGEGQLLLLYSEAAVYHPTLDEYRSAPNQWSSDSSLGLERGVSNVSVSEDYPGFHVDQLPDCILLFPSFKGERARAVISKVDPALTVGGADKDKVVWFLGVPHRDDNAWRLAAMREINAVGEDAIRCDVSTFDYRDALQKLEEVYLRRAGHYRFSLSPMGSKMQAIGAAMFAYLHQDVAVVFATPMEYNAAQYSDGCADKWTIDFGKLAELRGALDMVGTLSVEE
jgi:hypothetical protein